MLFRSEAADAATAKTPDRPRFVAGSIGPTNKQLSIAGNVADPGHRDVTFDQMVATYREQVEALLEGDVDLLLAETAFDTLVLKSCLYAIEQVFQERGVRIPVMASFTVFEGGRTLSAQTVEACWESIRHADLASVGINCALGPEKLRPHLADLSRVANIPVSCYPNAGLPNALGGFDETPEMMAKVLGEFAREGWLNVIGGCCGTTPPHIKAIAEAVSKFPPRVPAEPEKRSRYSGLELLEIRPESSFTVIGDDLLGQSDLTFGSDGGNLGVGIEGMGWRTVAREQTDSPSPSLTVRKAAKWRVFVTERAVRRRLGSCNFCFFSGPSFPPRYPDLPAP